MKTIVRTAPANIEAEAVTIGSMILGGVETVARVREILTADAFHRPAHAALFRAIVKLTDKGEPVDGVTVATAANLDTDGRAYLAELLQGTPSAVNAPFYARCVADAARLRDLIVLAGEMTEAAYTPRAEAADVVRRAEERLYALAPSRARGRTMTAAEAAQRVLDRAAQVAAGHEPAGLSLGWGDLDRCSGGGLRPGQLVVIAASTSIGKTAIALRMAANVAARGGAVKVFSCEMSAEELGSRLLAMCSGVDGLLISAGRLGAQDRDRLQAAATVFAQWGANVELTDRPLTVPQMGAEVRRMGHRLGRNIDLAVIDYLQIVPAHEGDNLREKINAISRAAKLMAQELRLPVLLLSQLSRTAQAERRPPKLHDLKESSSIEQDADGVVLLHRRPDARVDVVNGTVEVDAKVAKWRNGLTTPWGQIVLTFQRDTADFWFPQATTA